MTKHEIAALFDEHAMTLYRYVYLRVGHQEDAEDIISAVFEKVVKHHAGYRPQQGATIRSWLFAITRTTIVDHYRKNGRGALPIDTAGEVPATTPLQSEVLNTQLDWERVCDAIALLPERQQEIILLRYESGLQNTEIADALQINQRTVASALSKATATLRTIIHPRV